MIELILQMPMELKVIIGSGLICMLFNTELDPLERNNLININPKKTSQIENLLVTFNSEQANPLHNFSKAHVPS